MKVHSIAACVIGLLTLSAIAPAATINTIVDSRGRNVVIGQNYAYVQNNPLYKENTTTGENPLYQGRLSNRTVVTAPGMNPVGVPAANNSGDVAFQSVTDPGTATNGIFVRPAGGGALITIFGANFRIPSGAPSINNAGTVVFKSLDDNGHDAIFAKSKGGQLVTFSVVVTDALGNAGPARLGRPTINTFGDIAFIGTAGDGSSSALYVKPTGATDPVRLTINGSNFLTSQINGGHLASVEVLNDGNDQPAMFALNPATGAYDNIPVKWCPPEVLKMNLSLADDGDVAVCDGESLRVFSSDVVWNGASPPIDATVVRVGDALDGSTIGAISLSPQSWTNNDLTFLASLTDGTTGLFSVTVPEPTMLSATALAGWALTYRRKRR